MPLYLIRIQVCDVHGVGRVEGRHGASHAAARRTGAARAMSKKKMRDDTVRHRAKVFYGADQRTCWRAADIAAGVLAVGQEQEQGAGSAAAGAAVEPAAQAEHRRHRRWLESR